MSKLDRGIPSITVDEWLEWIGKPRVNLHQVQTEQVPPKWYLEMNKPGFHCTLLED